MPEMPQDRFVRYTEKYGLPTDDANLIISSKEFSDFYDESVKNGGTSNLADVLNLTETLMILKRLFQM